MYVDASQEDQVPKAWMCGLKNMCRKLCASNLKDVKIQAKLFIGMEAAFLGLFGSHDFCKLE